jgi:hypothetical protein
VLQKSALLLLQECKVEVPKHHDISFDDGFDSEELDGEFRRLNFSLAHQQEPFQGHPAKRRKIEAETDILEEIISNLYPLLGSQSVMDLDGSDQVAE